MIPAVVFGAIRQRSPVPPVFTTVPNPDVIGRLVEHGITISGTVTN
jgi:hypothetical protein